MNDNVSYYERNARQFFDSTIEIDMSALHEAFLALLPAGAHILDAGCGSGRDAKIFGERGYRVSAFDASPELAALAADHCGFAVQVRRFAELDEVAVYDGIWACASLLHVSPAQMPDTFARLWRTMRPGGCFYLSFKLGRGEREQNGRRFTDADDETLKAWLAPLPDVASVESWITTDRRPERAEKWLNALVCRSKPTPTGKLVTGGDDPDTPRP